MTAKEHNRSVWFTIITSMLIGAALSNFNEFKDTDLTPIIILMIAIFIYWVVNVAELLYSKGSLKTKEDIEKITYFNNIMKPKKS